MKCGTCGFECSSADLYFDHIMFDRRHIELAQSKAKLQQERVRRSRAKTTSIRRPRQLIVV
ncbi:hypothetical protein H4R18_000999 [Coemansia javaensis]|uniref:Uncharacterized protein n=1 Tax=Coemansia javaensis TaxID=2761396 RepID=A0A9W8HLW7_9FUNG|nr:hypothetical protein H4R18_000999 [Coemansia javaensis]